MAVPCAQNHWQAHQHANRTEKTAEGRHQASQEQSTLQRQYEQGTDLEHHQSYRRIGILIKALQSIIMLTMPVEDRRIVSAKYSPKAVRMHQNQEAVAPGQEKRKQTIVAPLPATKRYRKVRCSICFTCVSSGFPSLDLGIWAHLHQYVSSHAKRLDHRHEGDACQELLHLAHFWPHPEHMPGLPFRTNSRSSIGFHA